MIEKKKKVRRRRIGRKKSKNLYFHAGTHSAIVLYQSTEDASTREKIYVTDILPAFDKLVENLIFIHGFAKTAGPYEVLKNDCVTFLYETLFKFDHTRGTKAFSYFNVVAKNWLIIKSKQRSKMNKRNVSIDASEYLSSADQRAIERHGHVNDPDSNIIKKESINNMFLLMKEIKSRVSGENELSCINAIITLFEHIDELDMLNKRAIFVYMRDISGLNPKQLSISMSVIRKHYKVLVKQDEFDIFF